MLGKQLQKKILEHKLKYTSNLNSLTSPLSAKEQTLNPHQSSIFRVTFLRFFCKFSEACILNFFDFVFIFGCSRSSLPCVGFLAVVSRGYSLIVVRGLLIAVVASLLAEHGLQAHGLQQLVHVGSVIVARELSCSAAYGIFPDQESNRCPLHFKADS